MKKLTGFAHFDNGEIIRDEEVYKFLMKHSRAIDRISIRKMVEMVIWSFTLLADGSAPRQKGWQFYGKDGFFSREHDMHKKGHKRK